MPTSNQRANALIRRGRALRRFDRGLFYIKLVDRADGETQPIVVGIDVGAKKEAFTVKSSKSTFLNIQVDAVTWVEENVKNRREMRRKRRYRKTPYRPCRRNRACLKNPGVAPSIKARWQWKLRICRWLDRYFPISGAVVEDMKARTRKDSRRFNQSFTGLSMGKTWFYDELIKLLPSDPIERSWNPEISNNSDHPGITKVEGWQTAEERKRLGLKKTTKKLSSSFWAHCVDSWTVANLILPGGPLNKSAIFMAPIRLKRRKLHKQKPKRNGYRQPDGGTRSLGWKRGTWVRHPSYGLGYIGGTSKGKVSIKSIKTGKRLSQHGKPADYQFLCLSSWRLWSRQQ